MKVKNIMFAGFASAILSGICGAASAADYNLVTQGYVTDYVTGQLAGKADTGASYTKGETDTLLGGKVSADTYAAYIEDQADVDEAQDAKIQANTDAIDGLSGIDGSGFATMQGDVNDLKAAMSGGVDDEGSVAQKISAALTGYATEGYVTEELENYALKSELPTVPTNVSAFNNDAGYLTTTTAGELYDAAGAAAAVDAKLSNYATTDAMNTALQGKQATIDNLNTIIAGAEAGASAVQPGDNVSVLVNDSGFQTAANVNTLISQAQIAESQVTGLTAALAGKQAAGNYLTDTMENAGTYLVKSDGEGNISYVSVEVIDANGDAI